MLNYRYWFMEYMLWSLILLNCNVLFAQENNNIKVLFTGMGTNLRGISVCDNSRIMVCGSNGWIGSSDDFGNSWIWFKIKGFETLDFRDIHLFDKNTAVVANAGSPAYIFKTTDAGINWNIVYSDKDSAAFIDAFDFYNSNKGVALCDPVQGYFRILQTADAGNSWQIKTAYSLKAVTNEAAFAASGSCIRYFKNKVYFVTGGNGASLFVSNAKLTAWKKYPLPVTQLSKSAGAFSVDLYSDKILIAGGDYRKVNKETDNMFLLTLKGKFLELNNKPLGFKSDAKFYSEKIIVTCGTSGVSLSSDGGLNFTVVSDDSYNSVFASPTINRVYLIGENGSVAVIYF